MPTQARGYQQPRREGTVDGPARVRANGRVELSLNALVERLDDLFFERETRAYRVAAGLQPDLPPVPELPELTRPDAFLFVTEAMASPRVDDAKRARLELLRRHLARAFLEAQAAEVTGRLEAFLHRHTFVAAAKTWTPAEAARELPSLPSRPEREAVERELALTRMAHDALPARRAAAVLEAMPALRLTPLELVELLHGRPLGPRLEAAERLLAETEDAARDLLAFALKRLDAQLTPRTARAHDAQRAAEAPWCLELLRREDLLHAVTRCLGDLGLHPSADGRLGLDTEPRPGRQPEPRVFELRVPEEVRLVLTPGAGLGAYAGWLRAWGTGLHRAHVGRQLPFVERRLGDRAVVDAMGLLFESFLLEEGWLRRYLRLTAAQAKEVARLFAFRQLLALRRRAALALVHRQLLERGPSAGLDDDCVPRLSRALGAEAPRGGALFEVELFGGDALALDGWALETALHAWLRERFNEDAYRNPAAGRWLAGLAARGQGDDAAALAREVGAEGLDLLQAARRRVTVMGA